MSEVLFLLRKARKAMSQKILIVEDDQAILEMYQIKLESEGYKVSTASNGQLGLEAAQKIKPDVILLDLMMPEMTGDEMLKKLRSTDWGKKMSVVILTNMGEAEMTESVFEMGIEGFLVKAQYTPTQVIEKLKEILTI